MRALTSRFEIGKLLPFRVAGALGSGAYVCVEAWHAETTKLPRNGFGGVGNQVCKCRLLATVCRRDEGTGRKLDSRSRGSLHFLDEQNVTSGTLRSIAAQKNYNFNIGLGSKLPLKAFRENG